MGLLLEAGCPRGYSSGVLSEGSGIDPAAPRRLQAMPVRLAPIPLIRRIGVIGCAALATVGCKPSADAGQWAGSVIDSAGVSIVINPTDGLWSDHEVWRVEEDLRIGQFGGDPDYEFAQVGSIALGSTGEIIVMDRQARELRVFGPAGEFLRSFGSPGSGPGQFGLGATDVFVAVGDTLLVPDVRNRRVHRFTMNGDLVDAAPLDGSRYRPLRFLWNANSRRAVAQLRPTGVLLDSATGAVDELRLMGSDGMMGERLLSFPSGGLLGPNIVRYFTPEPMWAVTDSLSVFHGVNSDYRVGSYARDGTLRRLITRPHERRPITDRDIHAFFAYLDRAWLSAGVPPARLEANHRRVSFAEYFPAFSTFHIGYLGSLWVQPVQAPGDLTDEEIERYNFIEDFGASEWDVFDREGRFLGQVVMPSRFQPRLFVDDLIYGVARDDFDVQYVVRMRVVAEQGK